MGRLLCLISSPPTVLLMPETDMTVAQPVTASLLSQGLGNVCPGYTNQGHVMIVRVLDM